MRPLYYPTQQPKKELNMSEEILDVTNKIAEVEAELKQATDRGLSINLIVALNNRLAALQNTYTELRKERNIQQQTGENLFIRIFFSFRCISYQLIIFC